MTQIDPRIRVCGVCATVLDHVAEAAPARPDVIARRVTEGFAHLLHLVAEHGADDHPPVPVQPGDVFTITFCDFCYEPDPGFELPVNDFAYADGENGSVGNWAICARCVPLVERNEWNAILRRYAAGFYARYGEHPDPFALSSLRVNHRRLRANITGAPRPTTYPSPHDTKDEQ